MFLSGEQLSFDEGNCVKIHSLVASVGVGIFVLFVYVAVKHGEPNEEGQADEVFHTFNVRIIIYQCENFFDFAYR
jgi:hypothetical protein